jgi:hypothetical protein
MSLAPGAAVRGQRLSPAAAFHVFLVAAAAAGLAACSGMLPRSSETTLTAWNSFDDAKAAFDRIAPNQTDLAALRALGFAPEVAENVRILSYLDLQTRFMPNQSIGWSDLDANVRACLQSHTQCIGLQVQPQQVRRDRVGNAMLDIFNFRREIVETGWQFEALILLKDDMVLYKTWGGQPKIHQHERKDNPLGPLQDLGGFAGDRVQEAL